MRRAAFRLIVLSLVVIGGLVITAMVRNRRATEPLGGWAPMKAIEPPAAHCDVKFTAKLQSPTVGVLRFGTMACGSVGTSPFLSMGDPEPTYFELATPVPGAMPGLSIHRSTDGRHLFFEVGDAVNLARRFFRSDDAGKTFVRVVTSEPKLRLTTGGEAFEHLCMGLRVPKTLSDRLRDVSFPDLSGLVSAILGRRPGSKQVVIASSDGGATWAKHEGHCPADTPDLAREVVEDPSPARVGPPEPAPVGPPLPRNFDWVLADWRTSTTGEWLVDESGSGRSVRYPNTDKWGAHFDGSQRLTVPDAPALAFANPLLLEVRFNNMELPRPTGPAIHLLTRGDADGRFAWDLALSDQRLRFRLMDETGKTETLEMPFTGGAVFAQFDAETGRMWLISMETRSGGCYRMTSRLTKLRPAVLVDDARVHLLDNLVGRISSMSIWQGLMIPDSETSCSLHSTRLTPSKWAAVSAPASAESSAQTRWFAPLLVPAPR